MNANGSSPVHGVVKRPLSTNKPPTKRSSWYETQNTASNLVNIATLSDSSDELLSAVNTYPFYDCPVAPGEASDSALLHATQNADWTKQDEPADTRMSSSVEPVECHSSNGEVEICQFIDDKERNTTCGSDRNTQSDHFDLSIDSSSRLEFIEQPETSYRRRYVSDHRGRIPPCIGDRTGHNYLSLRFPKTIDFDLSSLALEVTRLTCQFNGHHFYSPHKLIHVETINDEVTPTNPIHIPIEAREVQDGVFKVRLALVQSKKDDMKQPLKMFSQSDQCHFDVKLNPKRFKEKYQLFKSQLAFTLCLFESTNRQIVKHYNETTIISDVITEQDRQEKNTVHHPFNRVNRLILPSIEDAPVVPSLTPVLIRTQPERYQRSRSVAEQKKTLYFIKGSTDSQSGYPTTEIRPDWSNLFMQVSLVTVDQCHKPHIAHLRTSTPDAHELGDSLLFPITDQDVLHGFKSYKIAKVMPYQKNVVDKSQWNQSQLRFILCKSNKDQNEFQPITPPSYSTIMKDSFGRLQVQSISPRFTCCCGGERIHIEFSSGRVRKRNLSIRLENRTGWQYKIEQFSISGSSNIVQFVSPSYPSEMNSEHIDIVIVQDGDDEIARQTFVYETHQAMLQRSIHHLCGYVSEEN